MFWQCLRCVLEWHFAKWRYSVRRRQGIFFFIYSEVTELLDENLGISKTVTWMFGCAAGDAMPVAVSAVRPSVPPHRSRYQRHRNILCIAWLLQWTFMMDACPCPGPPGSNPNPRILFLLLRFSKCVVFRFSCQNFVRYFIPCMLHASPVIFLELHIRIIFVMDWINMAEDRDSGGQLLSE